MTYSSYQVCQTTSIKSYHLLGTSARKVSSAWTEVWPGSYRSSKRFWFPGVVLGGFFEIFEILGGAGDINNSISMPNY